MPKRESSESALYVRLPAAAGQKLDRASEALGIPKKDLVAGLVARYVDPDSACGLDALGTLSQPRRGSGAVSDAEPTLGGYSFRPYDAPEVLNTDQAARFLQIEERLVIELAEAGRLPGRKLGREWRFARAALVAWLSSSEVP